MKEKMLSEQNLLIHRTIITLITPIWDLRDNIRWTTVFYFNSINLRIPHFRTLRVLAKELGPVLAVFKHLDMGDYATSKNSLTSPISILPSKPFLVTGHGPKGRREDPEDSPH